MSGNPGKLVPSYSKRKTKERKLGITIKEYM
jgi:hypothetical protein